MSRSNPLFRSPFYGNHYPGRSARYFSPPSPPAPEKTNVVSIPVHFVGSDDDNNNNKIKPTGPSPDAAAIRIQSAFRGFLVRKNVKVVRAIGAEVDEIEMRLRRDEKEMDSIVRDDKERLKINEMLMRLLLRLDLVRGVRDYRKRVIRRVIMIQEMLDSIAAAEDQTLVDVETLENTGDRAPETTEMVQDSKLETVEETAGLKEESKPDVVIEESKTLENADRDHKPGTAVEEAETPETAGDHISNGWELVDDDDLVTTQNQESVMDDAEEESVEIPESTVDSKKVKEKEKAGKEGMKDVMEMMAAENEKLKGLVAELCTRSAQQCRLMGGLAERVEHLEKIVEKMERSTKKKRKDSSSPAASSVDNKCGRVNSKQLH